MTLPIVPEIPPLPSTAPIVIGKPVRGKTWIAFADLYNWCLGQGTTLVPMHTPLVAWTGSATETLRYRTWQRVACLRRIWIFQFDPGYWEVTIPTGGGSPSFSVEVPPGGDGSQMVIYNEEVTAPAAGQTDLTCDVTHNGTSSIRAVGVFEARRAFLDPAATTASGNTEVSVLAASCTPTEQIYYDSANRVNSLGGHGVAAINVKDATKRGGMFSWWSSIDATALAFSAGTPTNLFAVDPIFLARKDGRTATVGTLRARIYAKASDGSTAGTVTFTASSGDTCTISLAAGTTSYTWLPTSGTSGDFDVDCEDLSTDTGFVTDTPDTVAIEGTITAGAGTIYVRGVDVGHA